VNEQDSSAVRRRNDKTGVCGFVAAEVVGVAERRFLANASAEPQDKQNRWRLKAVIQFAAVSARLQLFGAM